MLHYINTCTPVCLITDGVSDNKIKFGKNIHFKVYYIMLYGHIHMHSIKKKKQLFTEIFAYNHPTIVSIWIVYDRNDPNLGRL